MFVSVSNGDEYTQVCHLISKKVISDLLRFYGKVLEYDDTEILSIVIHSMMRLFKI